MSIMQDYENIRKDLGFKYDAIEDYLNVVSPPSQYKKYEEELKKLSSLDYENSCRRKFDNSWSSYKH